MAPTTLKRLLALQRIHASELDEIHLRLNERDRASLNRNIIKSRLDTIANIWKEIRETHAEIMLKDDIENDSYVLNNEFSRMTTNFEALQDMLQTFLGDLSEPVPNPLRRQLATSDDGSDVDLQAAKLPKLELPIFSGHYDDWENFGDLFASLVHDSPRLSNVTKLQYLKSCMRDGALEFVNDISVTNANYLSTWQALKARYEVPRLSINKHLTTLTELPQMKRESASEIQKLIDETQKVVRALTNFELPVEHWGIWLVFTVANRLDTETRKQWEVEVSARELQALNEAKASGIELKAIDRYPKYSEFIEFLERRATALGMLSSATKSSKLGNLSFKQPSNFRKIHHASTTHDSQKCQRSQSKCALCSGKHYVGACSNFLSRSPYERRDEARRLRLCFNCLGPHKFQDCESFRLCITCRDKHHTLLHVNFQNHTQTTSSTQRDQAPTKKVTAATPNVNAYTVNLSLRPKAVILPTARVLVVGSQGEQILVRALLDQGSEATFISESLAQRLELPRRYTRISLSGLGASNAGFSKSVTLLTLHSTLNPDFNLQIEALVLPRLTSQLPSENVVTLDPNMFGDLRLADPYPFKSDRIDIILGADVFGRILKHGLQRFQNSQLIAQDTVWGWVISGSTDSSTPRRAEALPRNPIVAMIAREDSIEDELQNSLQQFWLIEEVPESTRKLSPDDEACESQFRDTHFRDPDGRYVVRLPLNTDPPVVGSETRRMALGSLNYLYRRFSRESRLASSYCDFMKTYEDLGHMEKIPTPEIEQPRAWYLPHHPVVQASSDQWKLRVVFDASRRTHEQQCLNEFLLSGPALQKDLSLILLNWRKYQYVFTADIVKMFRQIRLHTEDQNLQRILWAPEPGTPPVDYRLTTVTYGTACAPFLAIRTLVQLAHDEQSRFPLGAECLLKNTYVDDTFAGAHELADAIKNRDELCAILRTAGIELDKWAANHPDLLPVHMHPSELVNPKRIDLDESVKTLGVRWSPNSDAFSFHVQMPPSTSDAVATKRSVLSGIARLFDPLGWAAPITITAKILMQDLWILKCGWDSPLPPEIQRRWAEYCTLFPELGELAVGRWLKFAPSIRCQIHGFSDASSRAFAAAVYLKVEGDDGLCHVSLLMAKTKVAPVKTTSIPNLELCGAVLLVKLVRQVQKLDFLKELQVFLWSDSQVVLAWIRKHPCFWKTFVANRVSLIQTELPSARWAHVPTKDNPADLATRRVKPNDMAACSLWWQGPSWLEYPMENWPRSTEKPQGFHATTNLTESDLLTRFSSLSRLIRVIAYCRRPLLNLRLRRSNNILNTNFLTSSELSEARRVAIHLAQTDAFAEEIKLCRAEKSLPKRHPLSKLNPFVDKSDGILRVGGRLTHSALSRESKHPPILPKNSALSRLFVRHSHALCLHGGPTLTQSVLQQNVWIVGSIRLVKAEIRTCVPCQRVKPRSAQQLMGDLPATRVNPARPFTVTGIDYAGPFNIRLSKCRGYHANKGYIVLFVCFTTKAIHLEAVGNLETKTFLEAFRRFAGRRGVPKRLFSDNGTTFQGASRELSEMFNAASDFYSEVAADLANRGTDWSFIPPNSPHCGGLWEAGVKSTKHHLKRVIGEHVLTFEELTTVLTEIEACLNSRPLCPMTSDPDDLDVLTPAHFLIGGSLGLIPEEESPEGSGHRLNRYQLLRRLRCQFWKRWSAEYLHHLQQRNKWRDHRENFAAGQLVLIRDDRYPPSKWPLGRILETHPGPDGLIRVATVKTSTTTLRRHIARLCPLNLPAEDIFGTNASGGQPRADNG